jgi:hypothetical protein
LVSLVWLRAVQHSQFLIFGPAAAFLSLSPAWGQLYIPIVALLLLDMMHAGINILRPDWVRFHRLMNMIVRAGGIILCYVLIRAGNLVVASNIAGPVDYQRVARITNEAIHYGLLFSAALGILLLANDIRKLLSGAPHRVPAGVTP